MAVKKQKSLPLNYFGTLWGLDNAACGKIWNFVWFLKSRVSQLEFLFKNWRNFAAIECMKYDEKGYQQFTTPALVFFIPKNINLVKVNSPWFIKSIFFFTLATEQLRHPDMCDYFFNEDKKQLPSGQDFWNGQGDFKFVLKKNLGTYITFAKKIINKKYLL